MSVAEIRLYYSEDRYWKAPTGLLGAFGRESKGRLLKFIDSRSTWDQSEYSASEGDMRTGFTFRAPSGRRIVIWAYDTIRAEAGAELLRLTQAHCDTSEISRSDDDYLYASQSDPASDYFAHDPCLVRLRSANRVRRDEDDYIGALDLASPPCFGVEEVLAALKAL